MHYAYLSPPVFFPFGLWSLSSAIVQLCMHHLSPHGFGVHYCTNTPTPTTSSTRIHTTRTTKQHAPQEQRNPFAPAFHTIFDFFLQLQCSLSHPPYAALYYGSTCIIRHSVYSPTHIRDATGHFSHPLFLISSSFGSQRNNGPFDIILDRLLSHLTFFFLPPVSSQQFSSPRLIRLLALVAHLTLEIFPHTHSFVSHFFLPHLLLSIPNR